MFVCVCVCGQAHTHIHTHSEAQLHPGFIIVIDSVHCKSSKKLSSGIIILTVTNTLNTQSCTYTQAHNTDNVHRQNTTKHTTESQASCILHRQVDIRWIPSYILHARTPTKSTVEFITHTPPEARVPNPVTVCLSCTSITVSIKTMRVWRRKLESRITKAGEIYKVL